MYNKIINEVSYNKKHMRTLQIIYLNQSMQESFTMRYIPDIVIKVHNRIFGIILKGLY